MNTALGTILGTITTIVFIAFLFGNPGKWYTAWLESRERLKRDEMLTRRMEAFAKLTGAEQRLLAQTMPNWLNPNDPSDVEAWKKAHAEISDERK
jgi:hypothetical protein